MTTDLSIIQASPPDQMKAVEVFAGQLASAAPGEAGQKLTELLRELTGARVVLLLVYSEKAGPQAFHRIFPLSFAGLFSSGEFEQFCSAPQTETLQRLTSDIPFGQPLRDLLARTGAESLWRFPLCAAGKQIGTVLLLDLPCLDWMGEMENIVRHLSPVMGLALANILAHERIEQQAGQLQLQAAELDRHDPMQAPMEFSADAGIEAIHLLGEAVAARQRAEETASELSKSNERLELALEVGHEGIWEWNLKRNEVVFDAQFHAMLGYVPGDLPASAEKWISNYHHPDEISIMRSKVEAYLRGEAPIFENEHRILTKAGTWNWVYTRGKVVSYDAAGASEKIFGIASNITERKKLEAHFLRVQRLEGIGALASGIAHDLNNILSPVLMLASHLRDTVQASDSCVMLDTIISSAQRGADIIKQLLTFARGAPGVRIPLPLPHLIHEMDKIIRETFPRNIKPRVEVSEDLWIPLGDPTQLHQSLLNLCVNARDAMPDGGILLLGARNVTVDMQFAAQMPAARPGHYVCVSVSDTGTGIEPEDLKKIFDPFFTTKEIGKGTGLGLATVIGIVQGHDGFLRVESQPGNGSTFELYFPAAPETKASTRPDNAPRLRRGQGELILVVDDEALVRETVCRILESQGYSVATATQGAEGLEVFSRRRAEIRAVITDMMMPVMTGQKMIVALQTIEPQLLILGMTGLADRKDVTGLEDLHLSVLLRKPFTGDELLQVLSTALHPADKKAGR